MASGTEGKSSTSDKIVYPQEKFVKQVLSVDDRKRSFRLPGNIGIESIIDEDFLSLYATPLHVCTVADLYPGMKDSEKCPPALRRILNGEREETGPGGKVISSESSEPPEVITAYTLFPQMKRQKIPEITPEMKAQIERQKENTRKYSMLIRATEGFYVGDFGSGNYNPFCGEIVRTSPKAPYTELAAMFALEYLNKKEGKSLYLEGVIRANKQLVNGFIYFLTLVASDECFYEAEVFVKSFAEHDRWENRVYFIRPAVHYPEVKYPDWWCQEYGC